MKDALKKLGVCLWAMTHDWLTSKKTLTAILTAVAGVVIKDATVRDRVIAVGMLLLGAQGVQDAGKAAAQVKAQTK